ncbi:MAG: cytochrome c [Epsilonproteobacteria bacterium]|nr:cytochrome c [Campylobacterota bacterium]
MRYIYLTLIATTALLIAQNSENNSSYGKKVFETYCWGCHHQTSEAFGPSFEEIASKRSKEEIFAMISNPQEVSKIFGYKRNAMPAFNLNQKELEAIANYILSFKPDTNSSKSK